MAFNLHNKFRYYCSVQFSCSVMSDSLWPHGLQHTRLPSITNSWSFQWIFRTNLIYDCLLWSPCSPRNSQESSPTLQFKSINSSVLSFLCGPCLISISDYWKTIVLTRQTFVSKVIFLLFNLLARLVIAFLPRSKHPFNSWLQSPSAVILEPQRTKSLTIFVSPSICHEMLGPDAMILVFWMLSFKPTFSLSSFTFIKRLFSCTAK